MRSVDIDTTLDALSAQARSRRPLSDSAVAQLLDAVRNGVGHQEAEASASLIEHNLDLALDAAIAHGAEEVDVADLYQEGSIALIGAVTDYAAGAGRPGGLREHLRQALDARLEAVAERAREIRRADEALVRDARALDIAQVGLRTRLRREPSVAELAELLHWEPARVEVVLATIEGARALDDESLLPFLDHDGADADDDVG